MRKRALNWTPGEHLTSTLTVERDLQKAFRDIIKQHGYDPQGPKPGEDEQPDAEEIEAIK